jgi:hypothetical protein
MIQIMSARTYKVNKTATYEKSRNYYLQNRDKVLFNRRVDREFKYYSKELCDIMGYKNMLDTLRYLKKTYD